MTLIEALNELKKRSRNIVKEIDRRNKELAEKQIECIEIMAEISGNICEEEQKNKKEANNE